MACISDNPVDKDDPQGLRRAAIWRWVNKPYGVDPVTGKLTGAGLSEGRSFEDVARSIKEHVFGGAGGKTDQWVADIMSGRKTPLRPFVMKAWKAQYNRRTAVNQAKQMTETILREQHQGPILSMAAKVAEFPRAIAVLRHGIPLAMTHPGDLAFQPRNMGLFWGNLGRTIRYAHPFQSFKGEARADAAVEHLVSTQMKTDDLYDMALASKLKVGDSFTVGNLGSSKDGGPLQRALSQISGNSSERAWQLIKLTRFKMWKAEMLNAIKPGMSEEEKLAHGTEIADMANHATGAGGGVLHPNIKGAFFGPGLTESKLNRLIGDPVTTARTFLNMKNATPAERYVAWRRLSRATQYLGTLGGFLAVNWGFNKATGVDDKDNVNFKDPTKADFLSFKTGGFEWSVPGMHTEIKFLANLLAITAQAGWNVTQINKASHGYGQEGELGKAFGQYMLNKMVPGGQMAWELASAHDYQGRPLPLPWAGKGSVKKPAYSWAEYATTHLPIPLTGPIKFVYDELRAKGSSALDATTVIKSLIGFGAGSLGLHARPEPPAKPTVQEALRRQHIANQLPAH